MLAGVGFIAGPFFIGESVGVGIKTSSRQLFIAGYWGYWN